MNLPHARRYLLGAAFTLAAAALFCGSACTAPPAKAQNDAKAPASSTAPAADAEQGKNTASLKGQPAPDFAVDTLDGKRVKLSDYKGKVVLLDFWATWCPPCVAGLPHINDLAQSQLRYDKGLVVLAVNLREAPERVRKFIEAKNLALTVAMDTEGEVAEAFLVEPLPTTVVIDRQGKVSEVFLGQPEKLTAIDEAVDKALADSGN